MKILYYIAIAIASLPLMAAERLEIMVPSGSYVSFMRNTVTPEFNKLYPEVNLVVSNDEQLDTRMAAGITPMFTSVYSAINPPNWRSLASWRIWINSPVLPN